MTRKEDIQAALREFVQRHFPAARRRGTSDTDSLLEQGIIDSMGVLEIVTFIENDLHVTLTEDELVSEHFESVASMAELVHRKATEKAAPWTS